MIIPRDISIKYKLLLMQGFTSILVLVILIIFVITDIRGYRERKIETMQGVARVIGTNSVSALEFLDNDAAKMILSELRTISPEIVRAEIIDQSGKPFATYGKTPADSVPIPINYYDKKYVLAKDQLFISNDIITKNKLVGRVLLQIELLELDKIKQSMYSIAFILLLVTLGFLFLKAIVTQKIISNRLILLADKIKATTAFNDFSNPIVDKGNDEISILTNSFNNLLSEVRESQKKKDEFIGIASHELKTPLTSIKGYVQLLSLLEEKETNKQLVQKALNNVNKLEQLIKDLLDVSKIQSGQLELNMSEFNVETLLDETISSIQLINRTHEIVRQNHVGDQVIWADKQRVEQVLVNLLSNAIKYSPGEDIVEVDIDKSKEDLIIRIRDYGIGIPKGEQENIFERFYRTRETSSQVSGFGLGLYICKDIVNRHKGRIWVESYRKGSAFYFSLPIQIPKTPAIDGHNLKL